MHSRSSMLIRKTNLSAVKQALLGRHLRGEIRDKTKLQTITRRPKGKAPLSFAQQRLWFLDQLEPNNAIYNILVALRFTGALNIPALQHSFQELAWRHEVLRTTFRVVDGQPVQVIASELELSVQVIDLRGFIREECEAQVRRLATEEAQLPFNLAQGPLLRTTLLRLADEDDEPVHVLLLTMHHIVSDDWSGVLCFKELVALYNAFSFGQPSPLSPVPIQYADFAHWQRQWLQGEVLENLLAYWKAQLAGSPPVLELPTDRPRPAVQRYNGDVYKFSLLSPLTMSLYELSRQQGVTLFMTLLAAFNVLLYRYCGQHDICIGTSIANRNRTETEGLIGFLVNTLVLRTDLSGNPRFTGLLDRVREIALDAQCNQDLPFEKLVEELQPVRDLSYSPLFQVMFVLHNVSFEEPMIRGLRVSTVEEIKKSTAFDLTLHISETQDSELRSWFEYNTDLFDEGTIVRMAGHFQRLLEGIVARPEAHLSELPLLTLQEHRHLFIDWNSTQAEYPRGWCIHQLFEEQVERMPEAVAVVFGDQQLTYRELNAKANQLAHYLQTQGVGPEVLVAICVERSLEMVVGILGILKAGSAYMPLDPAYPKEWIAFMLKDARASILLTQARLLEGLPESSAEPFCMDQDWPIIAKHPPGNLLIHNVPANLAYVIYTSGSTGKPKGILVTHRNVVHSTHARFRYYQEPAQCFLLLSSFSFDSSVAGLFWTLSQGGCLSLPREGVQKDPTELGGMIAKERVSHLLCLPSLYALLLEQATKSQLSSLRTVIVAGEACLQEIPIHHYSRLPQVALFNEYGPTEGTVWSSVYQIQPKDSDTPVPIGKPVDNVQIYLLDAYLNPVPVGVPGELYIDGAGLARGYRNRPDLTAERFIPNSFGEAGSRLYRTGDLARYRPDGNIEFLGRIDHQVKLRGFRIELGEIETRLLQHPQVREAVVIAREDRPGDKRLVAYVSTEVISSDPVDLRAFLREVLPEYMVPATVVFVETLPKTSNGKVDRKALPVPEAGRLASEQAAVRSHNPVENALVQIWTEVLGAKQIGIHANFFELGGHSLLAVQVMFRLQEVFGIEMPVASLFEAPTIAELAVLIMHQQVEGQDTQVIESLLDELEQLSDEETSTLLTKSQG